jgi:ABC-type molybdate transport system substrate-binding protein
LIWTVIPAIRLLGLWLQRAQICGYKAGSEAGLKRLPLPRLESAVATAARDAQKENPGQQIIALPDALAVSADYGLTVMADASPGAYQFALFILSFEGQRILASYGFSAPNLPE